MNGLAHATAPPITGPALDNKRVAAALIDLLVLVFVGFLLGTLAGDYTNGARLLVLGWVLYYYFALELLTGQTLGKKLLGLRVTRADGAPADMRQIGIRTVLRLVDGIGVYLVGLVTMLVTGQRRQRLGDLAAGTIVTTAEEDRRRPEPIEDVADEAAPVVPLHQPEQAPPPAAAAPPAVEEPPAFEPYRAPEPPAPAPEPVAPALVPEPAPVPEEPRIELVPDPPVQKPKIEIVSPIDLVMADDDDEREPQSPPPPQPA